MYEIDHISPLKKTDRSNQYVLVAIDLLSKWVISAPVPSVASTPVVSFLQHEIIAHHGIPERIISDWKTAFISIKLEKAFNKWGITHSFASPAYPKSNVQFERANATVIMALKAFVDKNHSNWDELLPEAVMTINTAEQSSTGFNAHEIVYGRKAELPHKRLFPWPTEDLEPLVKFMKRMAEQRLSVRENLKARQEKLKKNIDKKRKRARVCKPGDLVLVSRDITKKGKTRKFLLLYIGPYQVVKQVTPVTYLVEDVPARRKEKNGGDFCPMSAN